MLTLVSNAATVGEYSVLRVVYSGKSEVYLERFMLRSM